MIRLIKRYFAIRSYVLRLSGELFQRFGKRRFYSIEQVSQAVQRGHLSAAFIAYAHAIFCSREDFNAHYEPMGVACTYDGLRRKVGRRYFPGERYFDAQTIAERFARGWYRGHANSRVEGDATGYYTGSGGDFGGHH